MRGILKLGVIIAILLTNAIAVQATTLKVDKLQIFEVAKPGQPIEGVINISNDSDKVLKIATAIGDFGFDGKTQQVKHEPFGTMPDSCARWLRVGFEYKEITAKTVQALPYVITVPSGEHKYSEYFALLYIESITGDPKLSDGIALGSRVRMTVVIKISLEGVIKPLGQVTKFEITPAYDTYPMVITYEFKNEGNTFHRVSGAFVIMDEEGNLYGRGTLAHGWAKTGETINVRTLWDGDLDSGEYDLIEDQPLKTRLRK